MSEAIHITTAIFYCNAPPHVGSAYEALAADVFARHQRRKRGKDKVTFLTGTDEHGDKLKRAALAHGMEPKAFSDRMSAVFRDAWRKLNVSFDFFVRTTDPWHEQFVQQMLKRTYERGDIYFADYQGLYCVGCERFYTEKELVDGNLCPEHNRPVEFISEGNYFLRLEKYREQVREHVARVPDFIRPERYRNEALAMLAEPVGDLCISRPKARLDWGIELPFDPNYVTYVWYDAFWAYFSEPCRTEPDFASRMLPYTTHFIGKDILKTHVVYWPAILLAAGLPLPGHINVHGYLIFGGARMSKSSGNIADPVSYETTYGPDVLRYFVMREFVFGLDGEFSEERLIERYNADLANDLGNFTSRVLAMVSRYFGGVVPAEMEPKPLDTHAEWERALMDRVNGLPTRVDDLVTNLAFKQALETIWEALDTANKYVAATQPFVLVKDPDKRGQAARILFNSLEALRIIASELEPFMPVTSKKLLDLLNVDVESASLPPGEGIKPGHRVKPPVALFPRIGQTKA